MNPERWRKLKRIFSEAVELPPEDRPAFLEKACIDDPALRVEIERLILDHDADEPLLPGAPEGLAIAPHKLIGQSMGRYKLVEEIGRGAAGVVYLGQSEDGATAAIKVLRADLALSPVQRERFVREATATQDLAHPGIVRVFEVGEGHGHQFFAMEYIEGASLFEVLENQRSESASAAGPERWVKLAADVADALHYAHERGIIHRDIKPQNLLIDHDGKPCVVDFGLAKFEALSVLTRSGALAGTPYYMSPEQALAANVKVDRRTDIFSLGVVLYEMLMLKRPFEGDSQQEILYSITFRDPAPMSSRDIKIPDDLENVCLQAMAKIPSHRYQTAAEFADDLRRHLAHKSVLARPPALAAKAQVWGQRHRKRLMSVVGVAAIAVAVVVGFMFAGGPKPASVALASQGTAGDLVYLQRLDYLSRPIGTAELLGRTPLTDIEIEPGLVRFIVVRPEFGHAELTRRLVAEHSYELTANVRSTGAVTAGMVRIPAGEFVAGLPDAATSPLRRQRHRLGDYFMDPYEVSFGEYKEFLTATQRPDPRHWDGRYEPSWDDKPVIGIMRDEARAYAEWAGKRLPTILEWWYAAGGPKGWRFPLGNDASAIAPENAVLSFGAKQTAKTLDAFLSAIRPVRSMEAARNAFLLHHVLGNVSEWVETDWPGRDMEEAALAGQTRISMGDDWATNADDPHLGFQSIGIPPAGAANPWIGFRCCKSIRNNGKSGS